MRNRKPPEGGPTNCAVVAPDVRPAAVNAAVVGPASAGFSKATGRKLLEGRPAFASAP